MPPKHPLQQRALPSPCSGVHGDGNISTAMLRGSREPCSLDLPVCLSCVCPRCSPRWTMCGPRTDCGLTAPWSSRVPTWTPQWAARWEHLHRGMFTEGTAAAPRAGIAPHLSPCCLQKAPSTEQGGWAGGAACRAAAGGRGEAGRPMDLHASLTSSPHQLLLLCDISSLIKSRKSVIIGSCSVANETAAVGKAAISWPWCCLC